MGFRGLGQNVPQSTKHGTNNFLELLGWFMSAQGSNFPQESNMSSIILTKRFFSNSIQIKGRKRKNNKI